MSGRKTLTMRNIVLALREVTDWHSVGVALEIKPYKLEEIRLNRMNDVQQCKFSLIDHWLRTDLEASWRKLASALDEAGQHTPANHMRAKYLGAKGVNGYVTTVEGSMASPVRQSQSVLTTGTIRSDDSVENTATIPPSQKAPAIVPKPPPPLVHTQTTTSKEEVGSIIHLLRTTLDKLIYGLTHSNLDVNYKGEQGMTLLHYAAMQGSELECLKGLIAFGANTECVNTFGQTPLDLARMSPNGGAVVALLESVGAKSGLQLKDVSPQTESCSSAGPNILTLSSSGASAIVQIEILQQIGKNSGQRIIDTFQWVVASGFGALFLLLIVYGNKTVSDVKRLYFKLREEVFSQTDMARRSQALDGFLQAHLGTQMKMSDIQQPKILVGALYKGSTKVELHLFNNCLQDRFSEVPVWKVARYTCALPLNIMEYDNYTSTDLAQPNLSSLGLRRIRKFYSDTQQSVGISSLVCVEAGQFDAVEMGCVDVPVAALQDSPQWLSSHEFIQRLAQFLTLQHCSTVAASEESLRSCEEQCAALGIQFFVFNPLLTQPLALSVDVNLKDTVESVIQTIGQVSGKTLDSFITFLKQN